MPTLVIDNVPVALDDRIQHLAKTRCRTPTDTVLEVLETAFQATTPMFSEVPLPQEPFLTEEICAPFDIPWPEGESVMTIEIAEYVPESHDIPDTESLMFFVPPSDSPLPQGDILDGDRCSRSSAP